MKTLRIVLLIIISMLTAKANAQIKILTNGNVGIATTTPGEALEINGNIRGSSATLGALKINTASNGYAQFGPVNWGYCHMVTDRSNFAFNKIVITYTGEFGTLGSSDFIIKTGVSYAYNGDTRITINNNSGNVGIGTTDPQSLLDVNGDISTYGTIQIYSDSTLKKNIVPLKDCFKRLGKLNGKSYYKEARPITLLKSKQADTLSLSTLRSDTIPRKKVEKPDTARQIEYGFIAQEVKTVFPELVKSDSKGLLKVNYIGLIPVIIEAIKQQQTNISQKDSVVNALSNQFAILQKIALSQEQDIITLKNQIADIKKNCCNSKTKSVNANEAETLTQGEQTILYQNIPNPFNQTTEIKYYIPVNVKKASLYVFNMQGSLIKTIDIADRGNGAITINGYELQAGMYLYSLTADGNEIDTKRMILTQ